MKNKIDDLIFEINMVWYNFRDHVLNDLARWCIKHCYTDFSTIVMAMNCMTDMELQRATDDLIAWRKNHPHEKLF